MESKGSGRRRFLKQAAALAGVAAGAGAGAEWAARGQSSGGSAAKSELPANDAHNHVDPRRGVRRNINHITYFTPLQDYGGSSHRPRSISCNCTRPTSPSSIRNNIASRSTAWWIVL